MPTPSTSIPFEASNSFCYRFARYEVLPQALRDPVVQAGQPVRLVELVKSILDERLSPEQQAATFVRARNGQSMAVAAAIKWYVPFVARNTGQLEPLGQGMYRLPNVEPSAEEAEEVALENDEPEAAASKGILYAFTFPTLQKASGPFPITVGKTAGDVEQRVTIQCRNSAAFEKPVILGSWAVDEVGHFEHAVHAILKVRRRWRADAPGQEWFDTTVAEIEAIIRAVIGQRT